MNTVSAKLLIELTNDIDNSNPYFSDGWSFTIDRYNLTKVNKIEVEVSFSFEADLTKQVDNIPAQEIPSEHTEEFQQYEEEVETILDLLSLSTAQGMKIKARSYTISSAGIGSSLPTNNSSPISLNDIDGIQKRFSAIKKDKEVNKKLLNSLRAYRLSKVYEDVGDKIVKLWSIVEQLFKNEGGLLIADKFKLSHLKKCIKDLEGLNPDEKERLFQRVKNTPKKTAMDSLIEGIDLMTEEGTMTKKEKKDMLKAWWKARNMQAHGDIIPKRNEKVGDILWDMESTVEGFLYTYVTPRVLCYIFFNKKDVKKEFFERQKNMLNQLDEQYFALPVRELELNHFKEFLPQELIGEEANMYILTHNKIEKLGKENITEISTQEIPEILRQKFDKIIAKLNNK